MALNRKKLEAFVKRQLLTDPENNPVCRLVLRHAMGGSKAATVLDAEVGPHDSAIELASRFEEAATDDAEGIGGLQSYVIASYFTAVPDKIRERFSFRLLVESEEDEVIEATDAPNAQGLTAQLMRHNEAQARVMAMSMAEITRQQNRMIERQATTIENLMGKHFDVLNLYETMMTAEASREIEKMRVTSEIARTDELTQKLLLLAPAVVNRLGGKKMLPEKSTPGEMMVMDFVKSLRPEQMGEVLKILEPHQQLAVMELIQSQQAKDEADKK